MGFTPEFRVGDFSFCRVVGGGDDGAVIVSYWRGTDHIGSSLIPESGWASVLTHVSDANADGLTYQHARDFHTPPVAA